MMVEVSALGRVTLTSSGPCDMKTLVCLQRLLTGTGAEIDAIELALWLGITPEIATKAWFLENDPLKLNDHVREINVP